MLERISDQVGHHNHQCRARGRDLGFAAVRFKCAGNVFALHQIGKITDFLFDEGADVDRFGLAKRCIVTAQPQQGFKQLLHIAVGAFDAGHDACLRCVERAFFQKFDIARNDGNGRAQLVAGLTQKFTFTGNEFVDLVNGSMQFVGNVIKFFKPEIRDRFAQVICRQIVGPVLKVLGWLGQTFANHPQEPGKDADNRHGKRDRQQSQLVQAHEIDAVFIPGVIGLQDQDVIPIAQLIGEDQKDRVFRVLFGGVFVGVDIEKLANLKIVWCCMRAQFCRQLIKTGEGFNIETLGQGGFGIFGQFIVILFGNDLKLEGRHHPLAIQHVEIDDHRIKHERNHQTQQHIIAHKAGKGSGLGCATCAHSGYLRRATPWPGMV